MQIDFAINSEKLTIIGIKGFSDTTGSKSFNMELSRKRAKAVFHYLNSQHHSDSINIEYFGEQHVPDNDMFYNRRVEIWFKTDSSHERLIHKENKSDSVSVIEKYEISNIYFIPDQPIVEPASFFAVDDAAKYLKHFAGCKFEIVGHVNYILPPSVINNPKAMEPVQRLSEERAKAIYDLLIERGIPFQSMTFKGVGNSQMVFKNPKNDEEKRKNMRVEILISCKK